LPIGDAAMGSLELAQLQKSYGPRNQPVQDISLTAAAGEFLSFLGPSGCGKSTLLRLIAGLEAPSRGRIFLNDREITSLAPGDRDIAMVFQSYALYPHMTVFDNLAAALRLRNVPQLRQRVEATAAQLDLTGLLDRKPAQLSGGQRQRVALGRALVRQPALFLLDEPLSNLDAMLRDRVRSELKQLFATQTAPVLYVTHDQTEAMTLSTRIAVLNGGQIQQLDSPSQIYDRPANRFVASFVGSPPMNLLDLTCQGDRVQLGDRPIPLPPDCRGQDRIVLGIRPEDLHLGDATDASIQGHIILNENLGMQRLLTVAIASPATHLRLLVDPSVTANSGRVDLHLGDRLHWFHPTTGQRLGD
jgi:multiple sugar transport system ATP-binding protein